ncbi:acyltransferase family protein [Halomonas cupida]|uniref:Peptidoglycan/LPS O-acetylase OafA/YrhL, contains acyltransferase and SGNH-hydrolase domains n=1 Tax=Halomonas cupida TaxID=44933 RepID=A0A1M7LUN7_9GAMM|nr:acyltransferase family protein [Halomonas cupida]SHM81941.1 Peptidoglycan/LPS O-acetylase OafA/YrhL, contains acyltransferase and SGNH-hydrolase domains [Halomonas cupida]
MKKFSYRPEIDGLRAIAVLSVVLFHAGFSWIPGGYIGVDVFFVISGYLITSIICQEYFSTGSFSFLNFYLRRIRRLFPALFVTISATYVVASMIFSSEDYARLGGASISAVFSVSNLFFWNESGYFDSESSIKPLLHTWSLSVEEQFYLLWPSTIFAMLIWMRKRAIFAVIFLSLVSFLACEVIMRISPSTAFYLTPFRVYEFGIGAGLALYGKTYSRNDIWSKGGVFLGIFLVVLSAFLFSEETSFPGLLALIPCVGAALCIYFKNAGVVSSLLNNRVSVYVGKISYSMYLVHWPLYVFYTYYIYREVGVVEKIALVIVTFFSAVVLYKLIENPMRRQGFWAKKRWCYFGAAPLVFAVSVASYSYMKEDDYSGLEGVPLEQPKAVLEKRFSGCGIAISSAESILDFCKMGDPEVAPSVAVWGDSHASALSLGIDQILEESQLSGIKLTEVGCAPIVGVTREIDGVVNSDCAEFNDFVMREIVDSAGINTVILASRWTLQIESNRFDNREGGVERGGDAILLGKDSDGVWTRDMGLVLSSFRKSIEMLVSSGKKVVLIYPVPEVGWNVPRAMHHRIENGLDPQITTSYEVFEERNDRSYDFLDSIAVQGVSRIYPEKVLCNTYVVGRCVASLESTPLYSDDDHLNGYGSLLVARLLPDILR